MEKNKDLFLIYQTVSKKFYFSLIVLNNQTEPWDLFMALNDTGLNLNVADLVKSLLITKTEPKLTLEK